jgi:hypothetical protein
MTKQPKYTVLQNALSEVADERPLALLISPKTKEVMVLWKGQMLATVESLSMLAVNGALGIKIISQTLLDTALGKEMLIDGVDVIPHAVGISGLVLNDARKK